MADAERDFLRIRLVAVVGLLAASSGWGQPPASPAAAPPQPAFLAGAYPARVTNPEQVARGREIYDTYGCAFCHGEDTRGGNGGPSLLRSQLVQRDRTGETIGPVVRNGVPNTAMVAFALDESQLAQVAEFLHSFELDSRDPVRNPVASVVTGNPRAGRRYFDTHCGECHSAAGDLRGVAMRYPDPVSLQTNWLMPRSAPPTTARVTTADGTVTEGRLVGIDEFSVSVALDDGSGRSFKRVGAVPRVEISDPLAAHKAMLPVYTDPDIHDVTAYLVTLD